MSRLRGYIRPAFALSIMAALAGCDDQIPTFTGGGRLPVGAVPPTLVHTFQANEFLAGASAVTGPTTINDFPHNIVAESFDGLSARLLAAYDLPDTVNVGGAITEVFEYADSSLVAMAIPDTLGVSRASVIFDLYMIAEPWDTATVSWDYAINRPGEQVPWTTPGGERADYLGTASWTRPTDGTAADSVIWRNLPGWAMEQLHSGETHGLMVVIRDVGHQAIVSDLRLEVSYYTEFDPDSIVMRQVPAEMQTFIYSHEPERPASLLRVGGVTSDRSVLRFDLSNPVPICPPGGVTCDPVPIGEVSLNGVELVLNPVPVTLGYRPVASLQVSVWRTVELHLGERAPLASLIEVRQLPADLFTPGGQEPVILDLTFAVAGARARGETELGVAILVEPEASTFAFGWFDLNPQLRFIYTPPPRPGLP